MKKVLSILLAGSLLMGFTGCGMAEDLTRRCGGYLDLMCDFLLGQDPEDIDDLDDRVTDLEDQVAIMNQLIEDGRLTDLSIQVDIDLLRNELTTNDQVIIDAIIALEAEMEESDNDLQDQINDLEDDMSNALRAVHRRIRNLARSIRQNERSVQDLVRRVVSLESSDSITEVIDPCGDGSGIDEVLFKMSSGSIIAWYKNLGMAVLEDGNYITTDKQRCRFTIQNSELVEND